MTFNPFYNYEFKAIPLAIVLCTFLWFILSKESKFDYSHLVLTLYYSAIGLFFVLLGIYKNTAIKDSYYYTTPLYVIYPLLFFVITAPIVQLRQIKIAEYTIYFSTVCVSIYLALYIGSKVGITPFEVPEIEESQNATLIDGVPRFKISSISTLIFAVPFIMTKAILDIDRPKLMLYVCLILGFLGVILSGRRMLLLLMVCSPFFVFIFSLLAIKRQTVYRKFTLFLVPLFAILTLIVVYSSQYIEIDLTNVTQKLTDALDTSDNSVDDANLERMPQVSSLVNGWLDSPLLGNGYGSSSDHIRNADKPWQYEIGYLAQLFRTGTIGFLLYILGPLYTFWGLFKISKSTDRYWSHTAIAMAVGLVSTYIAYSSNPYIEALDILWTIFLPVTFINVYKKEQHALLATENI